MCIHLNLMIFTKIIRGFISAQYVPMFTLTLDKKEITMPKNTVIFPFASDETAKYLNEQQQKYKDSLFLTR